VQRAGWDREWSWRPRLHQRARRPPRRAKLAEIPVDQATREVDTQLKTEPHPLDGKCDPQVMQQIKPVMAASNKTLESVDPMTACTNEFVDKLNELGFQKAIGVRGY
jgi:hypothetical protein